MEIDDSYNKYECYMKNRPHVVILGAGASCAAIPNGDRTGKQISAMNGFIEKLGLGDTLSRVEIHTASNNLEDIYMELDERSKDEPVCKEVKDELDQSIRDYMSDYELPEEPTIYDFLVLSLTSKDLIATFNWDPLLVQALCRAQRYTDNLPQISFLHGNVGTGFCKDDYVQGLIGTKCSKCGKLLTPVPLLYPAKKKDYKRDTAINAAWNLLSNALDRAYMITIFGYSAPKSDVEAIAIMKKAWGAVADRNLEEIEIVDIRDEASVIESWSDFIYKGHYKYYTSFFDTMLARCPRRSCEANFDMLMNCRWLDGGKGFKQDMSFLDVDEITYRLIAEEDKSRGKKIILTDPYAT